MPGLGSGVAGLTDAVGADSTMAVIVDYFWELVGGNLQPLARGTVSDFHDAWDIDSDADYMPEALPNNEGYWDDMPELVTNGGFDTDSDWTKETGWTISDGKAKGAAGTQSNLTTVNNPLTVGDTVEITYTISDYVAGSAKAFFGGGNAGTVRTSNGTFTEIDVVTTNGSFLIQKSDDGNLNINNISVKEYALTSLDV